MLSSLENVASKSFKLHPSNNTLGTKIDINVITFYDKGIYNYIITSSICLPGIEIICTCFSYVELYSKSEIIFFRLNKKEKANLQIIS